MRLTRYIRNQIADGIRNQIPSIKYNDQIEELIKKDAFNQLPKSLQVLINKDKDISTYLSTTYLYGYNCSVSNKHYEISEKTKKEVNRISELKKLQDEAINQVMHKISECLNECNTSKQFVEFFPEFEKFIPYPKPVVSNLPGNTIAKELAALGFPNVKAKKK